VPGIEGFYTGLSHPLTTPDQMLALMAAGLFLGGFALSRLTMAFGALGIGLLGGFILGDGLGDAAPWLYGLAGMMATAAALAPGRWRLLVILAAGAAGLLLGWASVPDPGPMQDRLITMAGSFVSAFMLILYIAGALDLIRERVDRPFVRIAFRVAAAWVATIAILMLALSAAQPAA
jgi:hydrogenase/urease accessory protein HupE